LIQLVLASGSPRRRRFVEALCIPFTVRAAEINEDPLPDETPTEMVIRLSKEKARVAAAQSADAEEIIIAADTIVVLDGRIMGKPADVDEAVAMLHRLRGRWHRVLTGLTVWDKEKNRIVIQVSEADVRMRDYSDDEIVGFIARGEAMDKAGAYSLQDKIFKPAAEVIGCYAGVMGFPLCHLWRALRELGNPPMRQAVVACSEVTGRICNVAHHILYDTLDLDVSLEP